MAVALVDLKSSIRLLLHIPRKHRHRNASDLARAIANAWWRLFSFMYRGTLAEPADPLSSGDTATRINPGAEASASEDALSRCIQRKCADGTYKKPSDF